MKIIHDNSSSLTFKTVVTIGTFDGVHIGHQKIIERITKTAQNSNLKSVVLTFFPHPRMVLQQDANIKLINTIDERSELLKKQGLDILYIKEFNKDFSRLSAHAFVETLLVNTLNAQTIVIGYDHHFGRNRSANINDLKVFGNEFNFKVNEIPAQDIDQVSVSSTKIRHALIEGDLETANAYLGYSFMLTGTVVKGNQLGSTLGFPTANLEIKESYKLIPKEGVYVVRAILNNSTVYGMMNIGVNPTVNGKKQTIETHFFNFNQSLYNKNIQINLLTRLRDEEKFDSLEVLKNQLKKDQEEALNYIQKHDT